MPYQPAGVPYSRSPLAARLPTRGTQALAEQNWLVVQSVSAEQPRAPSTAPSEELASVSASICPASASPLPPIPVPPSPFVPPLPVVPTAPLSRAKRALSPLHA